MNMCVARIMVCNKLRHLSKMVVLRIENIFKYSCLDLLFCLNKDFFKNSIKSWIINKIIWVAVIVMFYIKAKIRQIQSKCLGRESFGFDDWWRLSAVILLPCFSSLVCSCSVFLWSCRSLPSWIPSFVISGHTLCLFAPAFHCLHLTLSPSFCFPVVSIRALFLCLISSDFDCFCLKVWPVFASQFCTLALAAWPFCLLKPFLELKLCGVVRLSPVTYMTAVWFGDSCILLQLNLIS